MRKVFLAPALLALVLAVLVAPSSQSAWAGEGHGTSVVDLAAAPADIQSTPGVAAWPVPNARTYRILSSCSPYASAIRTGARAWSGLTESSSSGTPVECRNGYITDCGGGSRVVGCNWGAGQRIALYMGGVNDDALLAAHEFGHNWYGHSSYQCAGWGSPAQVMAPSICNFSGATAFER